MICECGNPKPHPRAVGCLDCQRIEKERKAAESSSGRLFHALRFSDEWLTCGDLAEIADIVPQRATAWLQHAMRRGVVEQTQDGKLPRYRLRQRRAA